MVSSVDKIRVNIYDLLLAYFMFWAGFSLRRWQPRVIVVTGSVGKTILLHILNEQFQDRAHCSFGANADLGIALDIVGEKGVTDSRWHWLRLVLVVPFKAFSFTRTQQFYVAEIDLARPKTAQRLASWLKPERTLWVSGSTAHAVNFEKQAAATGSTVAELIAKEMLILAKQTKTAVYVDSDSPAMIKTLAPLKQKVKAVKPQLLSYELKADSTRFKFKRTTFLFAEPQPKQISRQLAYCLQLVSDLKLDLKSDFRQMQLPPGRSSYFLGSGGWGMIDSSYNAQIESVLAVLSMFEVIDSGHKWAVIGDMIEQGDQTEAEHQRLAQALLKLELERLVLVGRRCRQYVYPIVKQDRPNRVVSFLKPKQALDYLSSQLQGRELVLFKGSLFLEGIIEALLKDPSQAAKLCRRNRLARRWRNKWELP